MFSDLTRADSLFLPESVQNIRSVVKYAKLDSRDILKQFNDLFTFTDPDTDSDPDSNPIPILGS